jgi:hypothetical protein
MVRVEQQVRVLYTVDAKDRHQFSVVKAASSLYVAATVELITIAWVNVA